MLKLIREKNNISQKRLSELTNIPYRTIQHWEQGDRDINGANLKALLLLCEVLKCELSDLVTDKELITKLKKYLH